MGRLARDVGPAAQGNADIGGRQRRGVVDAVADDHHNSSGGLRLAHQLQLFIRGQPGEHLAIELLCKR